MHTHVVSRCHLLMRMQSTSGISMHGKGEARQLWARPSSSASQCTHAHVSIASAHACMFREHCLCRSCTADAPGWDAMAMKSTEWVCGQGCPSLSQSYLDSKKHKQIGHDARPRLAGKLFTHTFTEQVLRMTRPPRPMRLAVTSLQAFTTALFCKYACAHARQGGPGHAAVPYMYAIRDGAAGVRCEDVGWETGDCQLQILIVAS